MTTTTIELSEVTKSYGSTRAVDGISVAFGRGVTGLLGPNGAGKTTLLRIIATVLAADAGTVRVLGEDPGDMSGRLSIRRRLGYFPQEPGYYDSMSAFDFVDYIAILKEMTERRARRDEVRRVLTEVGLDDVMHKRIKTLSGGMRRRVIVAQALLGNPELLVLDEPCAGLDPVAREHFLQFIDELIKKGSFRALILVTHHVEEILPAITHAIVLKDGVSIAQGPKRLALNSMNLSEAFGAEVKLRSRLGRYRLYFDEEFAAEDGAVV